MATEQQIARINDVLYEIHRDTSAELSGRALAQIAAYSEQHFHRVFQEVVGEPVHQYVRRTRLEQAANQLMFDRKRPVLDVAEQCGFASLSSFSRAFKATFGVTPGRWRAEEQDTKSRPYLADDEIATAYERLQSVALPVPDLVELPVQPVAYVRHQGYGRDIRLAWQTLQVWAEAEGQPFETQLGLHHSNPAWVPLDQCRYVACLAIDKPVLRRGVVNSMCIPGGLHAAFDLSGRYGELLPYLSKILDKWVPSSGFRAKTTPAFVRYRKNHFLASDERFDLTFYLPVSLW
ncbi:AraC family transcriptional regulator [Marinobacter oulmenensis]|uniref:AraC family transcriptional regulator n=1 Tax=Marinobacter oulmenensis TaxID=643747 RepID=A0A840U9H8_9GAMM|nr:helix-turn-helix domain-containing protein [Marinobacter oulmenensis]MBB5321642.1 AraC family transcriptional regulator [Marinobacter oulmenensis]